MKKETEIKEIEIFTEEQLDVLPQAAKDGVVSLTENLPKKELLVLNPLVVELLKIKELAKIKYVPLPEKPTKEETALHKANVTEFKDAKSRIVAFKRMAGEAKKAIKGPLDALGKDVLLVEKSAVEIALEVADALEKEFKVYLEAEAEKTRLATEKRNAKATEAINALSDQNKEQSNIIAKGKLITFLKYEMLEPIKKVVANAIETYTLEAAQTLVNTILEDTFEKKAENEDLTLLDEAELLACKTIFFNEKLALTSSLNARIKILELEKSNEKLTEASAPPIYQGVSNISVTGQIESGETLQPQAYVPIETKPVRGFDLKLNVHALIDETIKDIQSNINYFVEEHHSDATDEQKEDVRRCKGAIKLLEKTILYINNELPPAIPNTQQ